MIWYSIALFFHIVGAVLLFVLLTVEGMTLRAGTAAARLNRTLGPVSLVLIVVPGLYMVATDAGWAGWVIVGLVAYGLIAGLGAYTGISVLRGGMSRAAATTSWLVRTGIALGVVFDMTVKPGALASVAAAIAGAALVAAMGLTAGRRALYSSE